MRLERTCIIRLASVFSVTAILGLFQIICTVSGHLNLKVFIRLWHNSFKSVIAFLTTTSPDSTLDKSRISLIKVSRRALLLSIISMYLVRSSWESVSHITREKPSIAFNGVRISWLMLAKKRDFILLAFSASFVLDSYSANLLFAANSFWFAASNLALASAIFCRSISRSSCVILPQIVSIILQKYKKNFR